MIPQFNRTMTRSSANTNRHLGTRLKEWISSHAALFAVLITVLAAALRVFHLGARSLNLDEGFSIFLARASVSEFWSFVRLGEFNMVLYYSLLRGVSGVASTEAAYRSLSAFFGIITIPVLYMLGRRLYGPVAGLTAALLFAIHPYAIAISQLARSYALVVLLAGLSSWLLLTFLERPSWRTAFGYAAFTACAVYSHIFALLLIAAQLVWLLVFRRERLSVIVAAAFGTLLLLLLPMFFLIARANGSGLAWVAPLSLAQIRYVLYALTLSRGRSLLYVLVWGIALFAAHRDRTGESRSNDSLVILWLTLPPAITILASLLKPLLVERYLAICLPAAVLLAVRGLLYLAAYVRAVAVVLFVLIMLYSVGSIRFYFRHPNYGENWRAVIEHVLSNASPGDDIVVDPYTRFTFDYYARRRSSSAREVRISADLSSAVSAMPQPNVIWVLGRGSDQSAVQQFENSQGQYCLAREPMPMQELWKLYRCRKH